MATLHFFSLVFFSSLFFSLSLIFFSPHVRWIAIRTIRRSTELPLQSVGRHRKESSFLSFFYRRCYAERIYSFVDSRDWRYCKKWVPSRTVYRFDQPHTVPLDNSCVPYRTVTAAGSRYTVSRNTVPSEQFFYFSKVIIISCVSQMDYFFQRI